MNLVAFTIVLFIFSIIFQLFTGIWLFVEKYSFNPDLITEMIRGNEEKFINPKSVLGILEIQVPHLIAVSLTTFVILHFFYFSKINLFKIVLSVVVFISGILDIMSNILILKVSPIFSIVKVVSFLVFEFGLFISLILIGLSSYSHLKR
jgi:magnesium-transporting ATPase (P-type)